MKRVSSSVVASDAMRRHVSVQRPPSRGLCFFTVARGEQLCHASGGSGAVSPPPKGKEKGKQKGAHKDPRALPPALSTMDRTTSAGQPSATYVRVEFSDKGGEQEHVTHARPGQDPAWEEEFKLYISDDRVPVHLEVWDKGTWGSEAFVGTAMIAIGRNLGTVRQECGADGAAVREVCDTKALQLNHHLGSEARCRLGRLIISWRFDIDGAVDDPAGDDSGDDDADVEGGGAPAAAVTAGPGGRPYERRAGRLILHCICGKDLIPRDMGGKSDPYLVIEWNGLFGGEYAEQTKVIKSTLNPAWRHRAELDVSDVARQIRIACYDWNRIGGPDFMGELYFSVGEAVPEEGGPEFFKLRPRPSEEDSVILAAGGELGGIVLSWEFVHDPGFSIGGPSGLRAGLDDDDDLDGRPIDIDAF